MSEKTNLIVRGLSPEVQRKLKELAGKELTSVNGLVNRILTEYFGDYKELVLGFVKIEIPAEAETECAECGQVPLNGNLYGRLRGNGLIDLVICGACATEWNG